MNILSLVASGLLHDASAQMEDLSEHWLPSTYGLHGYLLLSIHQYADAANVYGKGVFALTGQSADDLIDRKPPLSSGKLIHQKVLSEGDAQLAMVLLRNYIVARAYKERKSAVRLFQAVANAPWATKQDRLYANLGIGDYYYNEWRCQADVWQLNPNNTRSKSQAQRATLMLELALKHYESADQEKLSGIAPLEVWAVDWQRGGGEYITARKRLYDDPRSFDWQASRQYAVPVQSRINATLTALYELRHDRRTLCEIIARLYPAKYQKFNPSPASDRDVVASANQMAAIAASDADPKIHLKTSARYWSRFIAIASRYNPFRNTERSSRAYRMNRRGIMPKRNMQKSLRLPRYMPGESAILGSEQISKLESRSKRHPGTLYLEWFLLDPRKSFILISVWRGEVDAFLVRPAVCQGIPPGPIIKRWTEDMQLSKEDHDKEACRMEEWLAERAARVLWPSRRPSWDTLRGVENIVAVAEGPLATVPLAMLPAPHKVHRGRQLVIRTDRTYRLGALKGLRSITYTDSLCDAESTPPETYSKFRSVKEPLQLIVSSGAYIKNPLGGAASESRQVVTGYEEKYPDAIPSRVSSSAGMQNVLKQIQQDDTPQVVYFSGHGASTNQGVGIAFSDKDILSAEQISSWNFRQLPIELVVLSACTTAENIPGTSGELNGFYLAWRNMGAKSALLTIWNVNDLKTSHFMASFWEKYLDTRSPGSALQATIQECFSKDDWQTTQRYWGAYRVYGNAE